MDRKKIIDKVIKLLALSKNNSETAEANSARNMAAELMAKHDIKIIEAKEKPEFEKYERKLNRKSPKNEDTYLFDAVARFNNVGMVMIKNRFFKFAFEFVGMKEDIDVTQYMIDILLQQRTSAWKTRIKERRAEGYPSATGKERGNWNRGFAFGVRAKLRDLTKMKDDKIQEHGLVPVNLRKQALDTMYNNLKDAKTGCHDYSSSGYEAGKNAHIHKGLGGESKTKLLK